MTTRVDPPRAARPPRTTIAGPLVGLGWAASLLGAWATVTALAGATGARPTDLPDLLVTDPVRGAAAIVAGGAQLLVVYLALITVASAGAALSGRTTAVATVRSMTLPAMRPVLDAGAGWALAIGTVLTPLAATVAGPAAADEPAPTPDDGTDVTMVRLPDDPTAGLPPSVEVMRRLPDEPVGSTTTSAAGPSSTAQPTTTLPATAPPTTTLPETAPPEPTPPAATPPTTTPPVPAPSSPGPSAPAGPTAPSPSTAAAPTPEEAWTIAPGDHLWHVASATLADHGHPDPSPADVLAYLDRLVAANAGVLVEPGNPDLVLPGQVFVLPSP